VPPPSGRSFNDVQRDSVFFDAVSGLASAGAVSGYADGTFRPTNTTTRAQFAKVVTMAFGIASAPQSEFSSGHFRDVPGDSPFFGYIEAAYSLGLLSGYSDGTFRPGESITRGQVAKVVTLAAVDTMDWQLVNPASATFTDVAVGSTYYTYVETALANGALSGYSDGTFHPADTATRGQIAKIVNAASTAQRERLPWGWVDGK